MPRTIFNTPVISYLCHVLSKFALRVLGWELCGEMPRQKKIMLIAGPHTSNWDFVLLLAVMFNHHMEIHWLGKHTLFKQPFRAITKWFGGIPVNRGKATNVARQVIDVYRTSERLIVLITPEGTRSKVKEWKTGFYRIAEGAGIPIVLGFCDFSRKQVGFGPTFEPSGDIGKDLPLIKEFYKGKTGKNPELGS
ncbi:MAG: lysophospholipid acyltransferase family protein [Pseudomonadales bacterium]